jgi:hypothetical protein
MTQYFQDSIRIAAIDPCTPGGVLFDYRPSLILDRADVDDGGTGQFDTIVG